MENKLTIIDTTANPAPLGLCGFGLTTMLLNIHNAGFYGMDTMILAMGIFFGGLAQVVTGIMEWKKGNMFGTVAFASYGFFWISLVFLMVFPKLGWGDAPSAASMGCYLLVWGILSFGLWIATFAHGRASQILFGLVVVLFFLLAISKFADSHLVHEIAGFEGIICGATALYIAMADVINDSFKRKVLPV